MVTLLALLELRCWIKVLGHREVPGRPALYGTTWEFLDYFNLKNLAELPPLAAIRDLDLIGAELESRRVAAEPPTSAASEQHS